MSVPDPYHVYATNTITYTDPGIYQWVAPLRTTRVSYLLVGGGGGSGGGYDTGGGGGGGGGMVLIDTTDVIPGATFTIIVGDGGAGGISIRNPVSETNGSAGQNTVFCEYNSAWWWWRIRK